MLGEPKPRMRFEDAVAKIIELSTYKESLTKIVGRLGILHDEDFQTCSPLKAELDWQLCYSFACPYLWREGVVVTNQVIYSKGMYQFQNCIGIEWRVEAPLIQLEAKSLFVLLHLARQEVTYYVLTPPIGLNQENLRYLTWMVDPDLKVHLPEQTPPGTVWDLINPKGFRLSGVISALI